MNNINPDSQANQQPGQPFPHQNQDFYRTLVENSHDIIYTLRADGVFTFVSPAWTALLGHPVNEIIGQSFQPLVHPADVPVCMTWLQKIIQTGQRQEGVEYRVRHANGEWRWHTSSATPLMDANGALSGFYGIARDITTQKQSQQENLQASEARFQGLVETLSDWVWEVNPNGIYTYVSSRIKDILGYEPHEVIGKTPFDLMPAEEAQRVAGIFGPLLSTQQPINGIENINRHKNGSLVVFETSGIPFYDAEGNFQGYRGSDRDITERRKANEELIRFQLMVQNSSEFINLADMSGNIVFLNAAGQQMVGLGPEEVQNQVIFNLLTEASLEKAQKEVLPTIVETGYWAGELQYRNVKSGNVVDVYASNYVLKNPETNAPQYLVNISRDITEQKQAQKDLSRRIEIETLLTTISSNFVMASSQNLDEQISQALELLGKFADTDRSYLFLITENGLTMDNTHEWCAQGVESHINNLKGLPLDTFPWLIEKLKKFEVVSIPLVAELPAQASLEKAEFQAEDIQSIIVVPIFYQDKLRGFIGFDAVSRQRNWEADTITVLRASGETFITTIKRIRLQKEVEEAFERRGYQAQIITDISQEVAAATELNELFERVVSLTKERLGYYHTQILRYEPTQDAVILIRGYGKTGQKMLEGSHKMPMGQGLIGTAAAIGETVMRPTLAEDPDWQPNPLLPDTKGEIAVPIKWQDNVLGVLDVQSNEAGDLSEDDRLLLESLCGQIAIAMRSAELLEELRTSRERYELSVAGSNDGLWDWDMSTNAVYFSPRWKEMIGYGEDELNNGFADFESLLHPEDHDRVLAHVNDYLSGKVPSYNIEFRFIHKNGSYRWILARGVAVRNAEGVPMRMAGSHTDITERRKIQENMAEALEIARLANWEYDVEKDLFTFNDQFYSLFHTTAEKVGGYQITSAQYAGLFVYPDDAPLVGMEIGKALNSKDKVYKVSLEHRIRYADGGIGYITVSVTVERDDHGKIIRFYGANQDITERHKVQEEMAERLEEINHLYRAMSQEGWKTYRETETLPAGFIFDQVETRALQENITIPDTSVNLPIKVLGGEIIGELLIADNPQNPLSQEDIVFLQQVSDQIALAMESARLTSQTQAALAQSNNLFEASRVLTQAGNLQELTASTVSMMGIPEINRAVMVTLDYNAQGEISNLTVVANWWNNVGQEVTPVGTRYPREALQAMKFFISPEPVFFNDTLTDERADPSTLKIARQLNLRAVAVLPLYVGAKQTGALILEAEQPHEFTENETRLFTALAPQIATVLENRRQFERAQRQAEREAMLNTINQKIQSATSVEAVLQIAARELGHAIGAPRTIAQLSMKDKS